ncbi:MAG: M48 family metalloprotease [Roseomonas sp.]|nr:M48 family metalloprotease [Roseomonas sp.]
MSGAGLIVDATAWTGRRLTREECEEAVLGSFGVFPIDREAVPPLYAETDAIARALGIPPPRLFYSPEAPRFMAGGGAAANVCTNTVILTGKALALPQAERVAILAHELAHIAAGHGRDLFGRLFNVWHRRVGLVALGGAVVLASPPLILAALVALTAAHWAVLQAATRAEEEADAMAARLMGTVIPLFCTTHRRPLRWRQRLWFLWTCYPTRRPWLHRWAAAELIGRGGAWRSLVE